MAAQNIADALAALPALKTKKSGSAAEMLAALPSRTAVTAPAPGRGNANRYQGSPYTTELDRLYGTARDAENKKAAAQQYSFEWQEADTALSDARAKIRELEATQKAWNNTGARLKPMATGAFKQYAGTTLDTYGMALSGLNAAAKAANTAQDYNARRSALDVQLQEAERKKAAAPQYSLEWQAADADITRISADMRELEAAEKATQSGKRLRSAAAEISQSGAEDTEKAKEGLGFVGRSLIGAGTAGIQMAVDVALGNITGLGNMAPMLIRSFGGGAQEAAKKGYSAGEQVVKGLISAGTEYFTERLFGGNPAYDTGKGLVEKAASLIFKNKNLSKIFGSVPAELLSEGLEEVIADILEPAAEWLMRKIEGKSADAVEWAELDQIVEDGVVGVLLGALGTGTNAVLSSAAADAMTETEMREAVENAALEQTQEARPLPTAEEVTERETESAAPTAAQFRIWENETRESGEKYNVPGETVDLAVEFSKATGRRIVFYNLPGVTVNGKTVTNSGYFNPADGTVYINAQSKKPLYYILGHELAHTFEGSEQYDALVQIAKDALGDNYETAAAEKRALYASQGINADVDAELAAEYCADHLFDSPDAINKIVQTDRTLAQRILDWIDELLAKLGSSSAQQRSLLRRARTLYADALADTKAENIRGLRRAMAGQLADNAITEAEYDEGIRRLERGEYGAYDTAEDVRPLPTAEEVENGTAQSSPESQDGNSTDIRYLLTAEEAEAEAEANANANGGGLTEAETRARQRDVDEMWANVERLAQPIENRVTAGSGLVNAEAQQTDKTVREKAREARSFLMRKLVDSGDEISRIGKRLGDRALYAYYNSARSSSFAAENMITRFRTDTAGRKTGESLNSIFDPIRAKGEKYYNDFQLFMFHRINIERMQRRSDAEIDRTRGEFEVYRAEHPEFFNYTDYQIEDAAKDDSHRYQLEAQEYIRLRDAMKKAERTVNKPVFGYDVTAAESAAEVGRLGREHPEFEALAQQVYDYLDNLMQYRIDSGLISQEDAERLKGVYPHYVPTFRARSAEDAVIMPTDKVQIGKTVKRAKGGNEKLMPLHKAIALQTRNVVREGSKNRVFRRLLSEWDENGIGALGDVRDDIKNIQEYDGGIDPDELDADPNELRLSGNTNTILVRMNGRLYEMTVSPALFDAARALSPSPAENIAIARYARQAKDLFQKLVTAYSPTFILRNPIKDAQDALFFSRDTPALIKNYPRAAKEIAGNGEYWQRYQALGGVFSSLVNYETGDTAKRSPAAEKTIGRIEALNMGLEQLPRLAEFMSVVDKNGGLENASEEALAEAMLAAADVTVNFGRSGSVTKWLNTYLVPFLNAGVQGLSKNVRAITDTDGKTRAAAWGKLALKAAALGVAPAIINGLLYSDDDDWKKIKDRDKALNYLFKVGDGRWIKIPKGRVLSVIGAAAQGTGKLLRSEDVSIGEGLALAAEQLAPSNPLENNIFAAAINTRLFTPDDPGRTWYGGDIESQRLQNYAPGERYDAKTDVISKTIGGFLNLSPKKINYLLDQYTGIAGDILLPLLTPAASNDIFTNAFTLDSTASNRLSGDFYDTLDEVTFAKNGRDATPADAVVYRWFNHQASRLTDINGAVREIEADKEVKNSDKKDLLRAQYAVRNAFQQDALDRVDAYREAVERHIGDAPVGENAEDYAYLMANRDVYGAEYALSVYNKSVYAKAQSAHEDSGISYDDYFDYYFSTQGLKSDKDEDGKTVPGSLQLKIAEAIDALPLDEEEKDALYLQRGYAESSLEETPWHAGDEPEPTEDVRTLPAPGKLQLPELKLNRPELKLSRPELKLP